MAELLTFVTWFDGGGAKLWRVTGTYSGMDKLWMNDDISYNLNKENLSLFISTF